MQKRYGSVQACSCGYSVVWPIGGGIHPAGALTPHVKLQIRPLGVGIYQPMNYTFTLKFISSNKLVMRIKTFLIKYMFVQLIQLNRGRRLS